MIRLTLPYPPSVNNLYATDYKTRRRFESKEGRAFKRECAALILVARLRPIPGDVKLTIRIYRPRRSGDLSNRIKALEDVLTGFAYVDDKQIAALDVRRFEDKANPRAEVEIEEIR